MYSIYDLKKDRTTIWDGVHNYEAINSIKQMQPGDTVFIYHSMKEKKIVGMAKVIELPFHNTRDVRHSWAVRLEFVSYFSGPSLAEFKAVPALSDFKLVTHSRLSVMEVPEDVVAWIQQHTS